MIVLKNILIVLVSFSFIGCGLIPAYRRAQPDYMKTSNMLLHGGSKGMVRSDWGEPAGKETLGNGSEVWSYENRQDGKTFIFYFDKKGRLLRAQICRPDECK